MIFRPEINPYVELIKTKPDRILLGSERIGLSDNSLQFLLQKRSQFEKFAIELGSGSGGHLVTHAQRSPGTLYVGSELRFKRVYRTAEKADELKLPNLIMCHVDARPFLTQLPNESCDTVFVLYPDPWDKQRWRKNRLMSGKTLHEILRVLKPGGMLEYKTDHHEYFASSSKEIKEISHFAVRETSTNYLAELDITGNIESEFESLFKHQGLPLCLLRAEKQPT